MSGINFQHCRAHMICASHTLALAIDLQLRFHCKHVIMLHQKSVKQDVYHY